MANTSTRKNLEHIIRKFRKKLRQIDNLERIYNRVLSDEEEVKVDSKYSIRADLKKALDELSLLSYDEHESEGEENNDESNYLEQRDGHLLANDFQINNVDKYDSLVESSRFQGQGDAAEHIAVRDVPGDVGEESLESVSEPSELVSKPSEHVFQRTDHISQQTIINSINQQQTKSGDRAKQPPKVKPVKKPSLAKNLCRVTTLEGHSDLITSLVVVDDKVITASRDTTLRCWDIKQGLEERIYGAHTETVTCVVVLEKSFTAKIDETLASDDQVIVSGSFDCSLKFWSLNTGHLIKSVYTFNPVTCICLCQQQGLLVSGSEGGKLELWDLELGTNLWSNIVFEGSVTGIKVCGGHVFSSSSCGVLKVHTQQGANLSCVWESENLKTADGRKSYVRHVRSLESGLKLNGRLMYGDDSRNIKVVDWKKGVSSKIVNHSSSFSSIDAICLEENYLVSSSYDLDSGLGYLNVRSSSDMSYLGTIDDEDTGRIICLGVYSMASGNIAMISGGTELKVWEVCVKGDTFRACSSAESNEVSVQGKSHMTRRAVDSEPEMSDEGNDDDEENDDDDDDDNRYQYSGDKDEQTDQASWGSWCSIL